jgi:hypothetical protein
MFFFLADVFAWLAEMGVEAFHEEGFFNSGTSLSVQIM